MKRFLRVNAHVALLCFGTVINALIFALCWPNLQGFLAGMLFFCVLCAEWILTMLTQRYGASWKQKRYIVAYICCYIALAVTISIGMIESPIFQNAGSLISPEIDSILFTIVILFVWAVYGWIIGLVVKKTPNLSDEFKEYYCSECILQMNRNSFF